MLSREEVAGVIAHELAHIKNRDTLIMTITATIAGAISMLAQFGMFFSAATATTTIGFGVIGTLAMVILAPIAAMLVQMAISRTREYAADRLGAEIVGEPRWLASALGKIEQRRARDPERARRSTIPRPRTCSSSIRCPADRAWDNLFSTHPATENRIAALDAARRRDGPRRRTRARSCPVRRPLRMGHGAQRRGPWG